MTDTNTEFLNHNHNQDLNDFTQTKINKGDNDKNILILLIKGKAQPLVIRRQEGYLSFLSSCEEPL